MDQAPVIGSLTDLDVVTRELRDSGTWKKIDAEVLRRRRHFDMGISPGPRLWIPHGALSRFAVEITMVPLMLGKSIEMREWCMSQLADE